MTSRWSRLVYHNLPFCYPLDDEPEGDMCRAVVMLSFFIPRTRHRSRRRRRGRSRRGTSVTNWKHKTCQLVRVTKQARRTTGPFGGSLLSPLPAFSFLPALRAAGFGSGKPGRAKFEIRNLPLPVPEPNGGAAAAAVAETANNHHHNPRGFRVRSWIILCFRNYVLSRAKVFYAGRDWIVWWLTVMGRGTYASAGRTWVPLQHSTVRE